MRIHVQYSQLFLFYSFTNFNPHTSKLKKWKFDLNLSHTHPTVKSSILNIKYKWLIHTIISNDWQFDRQGWLQLDFEKMDYRIVFSALKNPHTGDKLKIFQLEETK